MPTTSNFGWTTPADTDLVKDGAAAIRTLGDGIDTSLLDLKGGTTGQVLSKNSNTDLDYTWVTPNVGDITEVQAGTGISVADGTGPIPVITNTVATEFDAKGDLIVGTGSDTFDRLAVGTNGHTLVADSAETSGLKWAAPAAGGAYTSLASGSLGNTTTLSSISSAYEDLVLILRNPRPATDAVGLRMRLNGNTGNVYNGELAYGQNTYTFAHSFIQISSDMDNTATDSFIMIRIFDYANGASTWKFIQTFSIVNNPTTTTSVNVYNLGGITNLTADINEISIYPGTGNIGGGTYELFGVK